MLGYQIFNSIY